MVVHNIAKGAFFFKRRALLIFGNTKSFDYPDGGIMLVRVHHNLACYETNQ